MFLLKYEINIHINITSSVLESYLISKRKTIKDKGKIKMKTMFLYKIRTPHPHCPNLKINAQGKVIGHTFLALSKNLLLFTQGKFQTKLIFT